MLALTKPPGLYFQPHGVANIAGAVPTKRTQQAYYLFDYPTVAAILSRLYASIGTSPLTMKQKIRVSGHITYTVKNETNDAVQYECLRWTPRKDVPKSLACITDPADPNYATAPVYTGNVLNCLGASYALDSIDPASFADGRNEALVYVSNQPDQSPTFCEFFEIKKFPFKLGPGKEKKFHVGKTMLEIDTAECFVSLASVVFTNQSTWAKSFIPGATGLLFRQMGSLGIKTGAVTEYSLTTYSEPLTLLSTQHTYVAYDWATNAEQSDQSTYRTDIGTDSNTGNATVFTILPDSDVKSAVITANT